MRQRRASDLHVTVGLPPMIRVHGKVQPLEYPALTPTATREMIYDILSNEQRQRLENDWELALLAFCPALPASV